MLSTAIELAQMVIPGRDPSLSDIVFNGLGMALGVFIATRHLFWLDHDSRAALTLTAATIVAVAAIMLVTAVALQPVGSSPISRIGDDLVVRYASRASTYGLDQPEYWWPNAYAGLPVNKSLTPTVNRDGARLHVSVGGVQPITLGPTVGEGWTLLIYPDAIGRRWGSEISGLWILTLCLPIGFFATRARVVFITAVIVAVLLVVIPRATTIVSTTWQEWAGAALGLILGAALGFLWARGVQRNEKTIAPPPARLPSTRSGRGEPALSRTCRSDRS